MSAGRYLARERGAFSRETEQPKAPALDIAQPGALRTSFARGLGEWFKPETEQTRHGARIPKGASFAGSNPATVSAEIKP